MKKNKLLLVLLIFNVSIQLFSQQLATCKEIVGYYPNWQWYDRNKLVRPQTIAYSKYSIINYCFFSPQPNGTINSTDAWADENLLLGQPNWAQGGYYPNTSIVDLAHQNNVKIIPSIGGWTLSDNFPAIAADPTKRATFAQACVNLIQTYNFDGIDLDWEYPGYSEHSGTPQDKANFNLLLQAVRTAIDNYGIAHNKTMLLTIAVGAAQDRMDDVDWPVVSSLVDIINLMSYDFFGAWDANANHNAPLYAPTQGDPTFNGDAAVTKLTNFYNVPANKITLGVAFYGRTSKTNGTPALFGSNNGSVDASTFPEDEGSPLYYNVLKKMNLFTSHWDNTAKVPYLTGNGSLNTFVSYDDEQSIELKAQYIVNKNLRGAIIWEITGDYIETAPGSGVIASTPLVNKLTSVFCNSTTNPTSAISLLSTPSNTTVSCSGSTLSEATGQPNASTTCTTGGITMNYIDQISNGICPSNYTITRTWTISDACGNTQTHVQTINVQDNIAPSGTAPANVTLNCSDAIPAVNTSSISNISDNCSSTNVTFVSDISDNGTCTEIITRKYKITDACGNFSYAQQLITLQDNTAPTGTAPAAVSVQCSSYVPVPNVSSVTNVLDNCNTTTVTFANDNSNGQNCPEIITRKYKITDACGNFSYVQQTITVDDNTAPQIECASEEILVTSGSSISCPDYTGSVTSNDNCSSVQIQQNPNPGTPLNIGNNTVTFTATDDCGNTQSCQMNVKVEVENGVVEISGENGFLLYPNPANNFFGVLLNDGTTATMFVTDGTGKIIIKPLQLISSSNQFEISNWAAGVYFVQFATERETSVIKLIKK